MVVKALQALLLTFTTVRNSVALVHLLGLSPSSLIRAAGSSSTPVRGGLLALPLGGSAASSDGASADSYTSVLHNLKVSISKVEEEIENLKGEVEKVELQLAKPKGKGNYKGITTKKDLLAERTRLFEDKRQLRKKEEQLRDEELKLMDKSSAGIQPGVVTVREDEELTKFFKVLMHADLDKAGILQCQLALLSWT
eukprot:TRINITY_DN1762_c0_g1_i1.p2 TRINITY_DN1762_c0_g1~~TRINITY_DN1762_c0_g1_i1.p2  ORF type:complete len:212 (-),score=53.20 TRINITY_DN1762_c0_g1_i1:1572-2159(-)